MILQFRTNNIFISKENKVKVLITEQQYQTLLTEGYRDKLNNIFSHYESLVDKIVSDVSKQYKMSAKFALTYGAGIGAIMEPISKYLKNEFVGLEPWQISSIVVASISIVFFEGKEYYQLKKELENEGLDDELEVAVSKAESLKDKISDMLNILGLSIYKGLDVISYTFLLPILGMLINVLSNFGFESVEFTTLVHALLTSGVITTSAVVVRDVIQKIASTFSKKNKPKKDNTDIF